MSFPKKHAIHFLLLMVTFFSFAVNASPVNPQTRNALTFQTIDDLDTNGPLPRDKTATEFELTEGPIRTRVVDTTNKVFKVVTGGSVVRLLIFPLFHLDFRLFLGLNKCAISITYAWLEPTSIPYTIFGEAILIKGSVTVGSL